MTDMVTVNTSKSTPAGTTVKPERSKSGRNAPAQVQGIGPILRERREAMGVTLAEAEVATRIRQKYLAALESDEWTLLPGEVVGRGFLRNYATYLGLDATEIVDRRRAIADDSLAAVLQNTSAGTALPPERKVDYRPKDVALKDEGGELEAQRQLNLAPLLGALALIALIVLGWWVFTRMGNQINAAAAALQKQVTGMQATPTPKATATIAAKAVTNAAAAGVGAASAGAADNTAGAAGTATAAAPTATPLPTQPPTAVPPTPGAAPAAGAVSLLGKLATPTPQPTQAPTAASAATAANLRSGPGLDYPIVAGATQGQALVIVGRSADSVWYQLQDGNWVFAQLVSNPPANLPVVAAPPVPTKAP